MNENKTLSATLAAVLLLVLSLNVVEAHNVTVIEPEFQDWINGTAVLVNYSLDPSGLSITGITNHSIVVEGTVVAWNNTNITVSQGNISILRLIDVSAISDVVNTAGALTIRLYNETRATTTVNTTDLTIGVDNNAPSLTSTDYKTAVKKNGVMDVTVRATDISTITYAVALLDETGATVKTNTLASSQFSGANFDTTGGYQLQVTLTDSVGKTTTKTYNLDVNSGSNPVSLNVATAAVVQETLKKPTANPVNLAVGLSIVVIIILFIGYAMIGGKRRR